MSDVYKIVTEELVAQGFSEKLAHHMAYKVSSRTNRSLLETDTFSVGQMLVGNTLLEHRPRSREKGYVTLTSWWRRIWAARHPDHECMCGWKPNEGQMIEYHQADMINETMRRFQNFTG